MAAHAASVAYRAMIDAVYAFQGCRQFVKRSQFSEKSEGERSAFRKVKTKSLTEMEATVTELALWIAETLYICAGATRDGKANEELLETACSINLDQRMGLLNTWVHFHIPPLLRRYRKKAHGSHMRMTSTLQCVLDIDCLLYTSPSPRDGT